MERNNPFLNYVRARLWRKNLNWIAGIVGGVGTSKSWSALTIADYIDDDFSADKVFLRIRDFVEAIEDGRIKRGSCCILDEAGIQWGSRDFMKQYNKNLSYLFQIMRFLNFAVIMTTPSINLIDKHGRDILHCVFRTRGIDYERGVATLEVKVIDFDPLEGKVYRKWPRIVKDGEIFKADLMEIDKPRKELREAYESKKKEFAMSLIREIKEKMNEDKEKDNNEPNIICSKCGYEWYYTKDKKRATCPDCGAKVRVSTSFNSLNT